MKTNVKNIVVATSSSVVAVVVVLAFCLNQCSSKKTDFEWVPCNGKAVKKEVYVKRGAERTVQKNTAVYNSNFASKSDNKACKKFKSNEVTVVVNNDNNRSTSNVKIVNINVQNTCGNACASRNNQKKVVKTSKPVQSKKVTKQTPKPVQPRKVTKQTPKPVKHKTVENDVTPVVEKVKKQRRFVGYSINAVGNGNCK